MSGLYLKALEIQGFKSFPDKTVLTFGEDITAIVGPNGSGKSNISDAIRWVMGEQSTKALRGGKMEDVIFGGTAKRKQLGFAEVSLILDNTSHLFDLEESEVMVTRRYYRSGESEYYINRRSVRLKDINELFMDTGLGREGYSIIGQGRIDEILSAKSEDRREVFEEAAGISRYRHRKEEAERKLSRTQDDLLRVNDKIAELELQVEPLREQAEKAKKFLVLRDELRGLEISVWLEQLEQIRTKGIKARTDYEQAARQREEARQALEGLYAAAEEHAAKMREKDVENERVRAEIAGREAAAAELDSAVAVLRGKIQNNLENARRIREELEQQEDRAGSMAGQIEERRARLEEIAGERARLEEQMARCREKGEEIRRSAGTLAAEMEELRRQESVQNASASEARALLSALAAAAQELLDRDEAVRQELAAGEETLAQAKGEADAAAGERDSAVEDRQSLENVINGYTLRLESRRKKAKEAEDRRVKLTMEVNALQSRIRMLDEMEKLHEGFSKAVKLVMGEAQRGGLQHIHGAVAELLRVPGEYTVAIETALGGAMQNIVVDREEDGKQAISYLKRRDGGRATFLPLSSVKPARLREQGVEKEPGFVGIACDLIRYDRQYEPVFSNLLGRVVVAEDMDAAIAIARKYRYAFRIVTLDGQVFHPGGSMTGGSASRSAGILSRREELERLREQEGGLTGSLEEAARAAEELQREATAAQYELETAQGQRREAEDRILTLEERCRSLERKTADLRQRRDDLRAELEQLKERAAQVETDTRKARERIAELEGEAAASRALAQGKQDDQSRLQERVDQAAAEEAGLREQLAGLEAEDGAVRRSLEELERLHREMAGDREERAGLIRRYESSSEAIQAEIAEKEGQLSALREQGRAQEERLRALNGEKLALEAARTRADKESRDKNEELLAMEREVSALEQKANTAALEEKQVLDRLWETYELSHEAARQQRVELESVPKATRRIGELKRSINALGPINVGAIDDFQRVNERYEYLTGQRDDVEKAKGELEEIIAGITGEMRTIFSQQFAVINQAFGETFVELFGGGKAALELEDPDDILSCGIEIKVQPPGKALKVLSLLSGGEKAFVAIALYFAILKVRPTPFCVMDEIEAALDDANVTRFAHYLRTMSDRTQFIVITHRRGTMEEADVLYGVTMQERGISRMLTINLNDVEKELHIR